MPSFLDAHMSESIDLTTDENSPYEPPHLAKHENQAFRGERNPHPPSNKKSESLPSVCKHPGEIVTNGLTASNQSHQSLPNGRLSGDRDNWQKQSSPVSSSHAKTNGYNGTQRSSTEDSMSIDVGSKDAAADTGTNQMNGYSKSLAKKIPPVAHQASQTPMIKRFGHARAHSSSEPPRHDSHSVFQDNVEATQGAGRLNAVPISSKNEPQALNKLSSPPTLPDDSLSSAPVSSSISHPGASRLKRGHTLQVPRLSTGRNSRDFSLPATSTGYDSATDIERWSPTNTNGQRESMSLPRRPTRSIQSDLHLDENSQDEDMARWTETIRQKRASRRRRKEEEEDDRVVVGTKVDMNHVNWVTAYNMLTGIRFTVSRTNAKMDRLLDNADFDTRQKFSFDIAGNELTPSAIYDFKFKDYAPWVFRHIRARFKLDPADYLMSLTSKYILSELGSPGKSGSFFYFSRDYKYIIKTIHHAEHKLLRRVLRDYWEHIDENPNTLLSQFYGLHRVKIPYGRKIHFVVMNNLFPPHRDIHQTFDLKGSTVGRDFSEADLERNPRATLKDLNWLRRNYHFEFGPNKKHLFVEQMKRDVALLQRLKIMDYSLLVGIHDLSKGNEENLRDRTLQVFQPGSDRSAEPQPSILTRTPSKLENQRKARELRQIIKKEKPVPMEKSTSKMPDEMLGERKNFIFYSDDGGFRATHEDGEPGEEIYYLGIIDCLTHYGLVKRVEHFWKGMSNDKTQISPIPPESYGERFVKFITGLTKTREEAEREGHSSDQTDGSIHTNRQNSLHLSRNSTEKVIDKAEKQVQKTKKHGTLEDNHRDRTLSALRSPSAERTGGTAGATLPVVQEDGEGGSREDSVVREKEDYQLSEMSDLSPSPPQGPNADSIPTLPVSMESRLSNQQNKPPPSLPQIPHLSSMTDLPTDAVTTLHSADKK